MSPLSRRRLLGSAGLGAAGLGLGGAGFLVGRDTASAAEGTGDVVVFHGPHQAGIDTPVQDRLHFAAFDLIDDDPAALRSLLEQWSAAAAEMTRGRLVGEVNDVALAPPEDTGEKVGLPPSSLTVTFGFGPSSRRGSSSSASSATRRISSSRSRNGSAASTN